MEFKGTKGNWVISDQDKNGLFVVAENHQRAICRIYIDNNSVNGERNEGIYNSKLTSKAPQLLHSCQELLALLRFHGYTHSKEITEATQNIKEATEI